MANRIMLNETSYHGSGAINEIANEIKARGFKKAFVCSDPDLIKFGVTKKVTDVLDGASIAYSVYSDIKANPTIENVQHGVKAFKEAGTDCIVAIGGGENGRGEHPYETGPYRNPEGEDHVPHHRLYPVRFRSTGCHSAAGYPVPG